MNTTLFRDFAPIESNVFRRNDGTTHYIYQVPGQWEGSYILMGAVGGNIYVLFGWNSGVTADPTKYSARVGGSPPYSLTPDIDSPDRIAEDTVSRIWVPKDVREGAPGKSAATHSRSIQYFGIVGDSPLAEWFAYAITEKPGLID